MLNTRRGARARRLIVTALLGCMVSLATGLALAAPAPAPLLAKGQAVDWWVVYKFSEEAFPSDPDDKGRACPFDKGGPAAYDQGFSQKYVVASSKIRAFADGPGLIGTSEADPLGATFKEIYSGAYYYVTWNDQFHGSPLPDRGAPWGHAKGILAWNEQGQGLLLQVTTPDWPGAGSLTHPRAGPNTLGCMTQNDVEYAQDFFALKLSRDDLKKVLHALDVANVVTDVGNPQLVNVRAGGVTLPADLAALVQALGKTSPSKNTVPGDDTLSSKVRVISKPSALAAPPWQFLSSMLGGVPLRAATWWMSPAIPTTTTGQVIPCWPASLKTPPGGVAIATTGHHGAEIRLTGPPSHAKMGVSDDKGATHYAIFGDLNQQGQIVDTKHSPPTCTSSQNGRGGMFFVIDDLDLYTSLTKLIQGRTAPEVLSAPGAPGGL